MTSSAKEPRSQAIAGAEKEEEDVKDEFSTDSDDEDDSDGEGTVAAIQGDWHEISDSRWIYSKKRHPVTGRFSSKLATTSDPSKKSVQPSTPVCENPACISHKASPQRKKGKGKCNPSSSEIDLESEEVQGKNYKDYKLVLKNKEVVLKNQERLMDEMEDQKRDLKRMQEDIGVLKKRIRRIQIQLDVLEFRQASRPEFKRSEKKSRRE